MTTSVALSPVAILQFFDNTGKPAVGGALLTQSGGVNYPTYSEATGTTALPNPIPLNSRGEVSTTAGASSPLFLQTGVAYTFTLKDSAGNQLWSIGSITSINGQAVSFPTATGSANAQIVTNAAPISLGNGTVQWFLPVAANTGAVTVNADGSGAKNVFWLSKACVGGELQIGVPAQIIYDGTQWNLTQSSKGPAADYYVDTGAVNALVITANMGQTAYVDGMSWKIKVSNTTTNSTPTINVNALGAKNLYYPDGTTQILAGALILNNIYRMTYDSSLNAAAGAFIVESASSITGSFTQTITGTTGLTGTTNYRAGNDGKGIDIWIPTNILGTSNATTMTGTGIPTLIQASTDHPNTFNVVNSGANIQGTISGLNTNTWVYSNGVFGNSNTFTNTGTKGLQICGFRYTRD